MELDKVLCYPGAAYLPVNLLALPLWYDRQINHPRHQLIVDYWNGLKSKMADKQMTLNFLQVRQPNEDPKRKAWDVLHFKSNTTSVDSKAMKDFLPLKGSLLVLSAFAAAAYTCQYAILKAASSQQALIWIGCQGALAAFRL